MKKANVLAALRQEATGIAPKLKHGEKRQEKAAAPGSPEHIRQMMSRYNRANFTELLTTELTDGDQEIDAAALGRFTSLIDDFMDRHAPGEPVFAAYIRIISTYLAFIARKPLHPVGLHFSATDHIYESGGSYFCPEKKRQIDAEGSLCPFCVCKFDYSREE